MSKTCISILKKMYHHLECDPSHYFGYKLIDNNLQHWELVIFGVEGTVLSKGQFPVEIIFPDDFPFSMPKMFFKCPIYHPNINLLNGEFCITDQWEPSITIEQIVLHTILILQKPNLDTILNSDAAEEYMKNPESYENIFRVYIRNSHLYL